MTDIDDRLWDPSASAGPRVDDLEARLASLRAPVPMPELALPPRSRAAPMDEERASSRRVGLLVAGAVLLAAAAVALWIGRSPSLSSPSQTPGSDEAVATAEWRVVALDRDSQCNGTELGVGGAWPEDAAIETGPIGTAHLEKGTAELVLHPRGRLSHRGDVLVLEQGRVWADLPAPESGAPWVIEVGGHKLRVPGGRLILWVSPQEGVGFEVLRGSVQLAGPEGPSTVDAGQTCTASFEPGPLYGTGLFRCESSDGG